MDFEKINNPIAKREHRCYNKNNIYPDRSDRKMSDTVNGLINFIHHSPTAFHAVSSAADILTIN